MFLWFYGLFNQFNSYFKKIFSSITDSVMNAHTFVIDFFCIYYRGRQAIYKVRNERKSEEEKRKRG